MICNLAEAMVVCGYSKDGIYNSRTANYSGRRGRATVLYWRNGKILLGRGGTKIGKDYKANPPVHPREWTAHELINVAQHLAPFLDALENNVRWQVEQLEKAVQTIQEVIGRVEADPKPSDQPAQMPEDPEVDGPGD
jgi:hypothetical protein